MCAVPNHCIDSKQTQKVFYTNILLNIARGSYATNYIIIFLACNITNETYLKCKNLKKICTNTGC